METAVLVLAPTGRDAAMMCDALRASGIIARPFDDVPSVCAAIDAGAGSLLVAEEAFEGSSFPLLAAALDRQEPWSDLPVVLLAGADFTDSVVRAERVLTPLRNVMVLERPLRVSVLVTAMRVALRARARQYELRGHLAEREREARERALFLESERQARAEAEDANRLKDEFLATVSHELRTPVNVILGWSAMLTDNGLDPAQRARASAIIHRNAQTQARVIDELLDISRIITGKLRMEIDRVELRPLVQEAVDAVRPAVEAKQIAIEMTCPASLPHLLADADRLRQILFNLLTNAVKFTPDGGRITVTVAHEERCVDIRVRDSGIGIPPEVLPFVFDRFRQADSTTTRIHGGLGLGLAIVRQLVELHGGTVQASSGGAGAGAEFVVRLPAARAAESKPASSSVSSPGERKRRTAC